MLNSIVNTLFKTTRRSAATGAIFSTLLFGCTSERVQQSSTSNGIGDVPQFDSTYNIHITEGISFQERYDAQDAKLYSIDTELDSSLFNFDAESAVLTVTSTDDAHVGSYWTKITAYTSTDIENEDTLFSELMFPLIVENVPERAQEISPQTLESAMLHEAYFQEIEGINDPDPDHEITEFEIMNGSLPLGIEFDNGVFSGTPEEYGTFSFTVRATGREDPLNVFLQRGYSLEVEDPGVLFSVRTRNAYEGAHNPEYLEGMQVEITLEDGDVYLGITDSTGTTDFVLPTNTFSDSDEVEASLVVRDELISGVGPTGDCSLLPYGVSQAQCVGNFFDYESDIKISGTSGMTQDVWLIENYSVFYQGYNDFYKYFTDKTSTSYSSGEYYRWDKVGSLSAFPLLVYIAEHENEGINFQDKVIEAVEVWNDNPQGLTYFDVTTDPADQYLSDVRVSFQYNSSSNTFFSSDPHHLINYAIVRIENDLNVETLVLHEANQQLGRTLGHRNLIYGEESSVFGTGNYYNPPALYPNDLDRTFVYIVSTHPDHTSRVHKLD